jgi:transcriptional regulator with XRE-family HTH domain
MQAIYAINSNSRYDSDMPGGRPPKLKRSPFGERLVTIRQQFGLSQSQVAEKLGVSQQAYAGWERSTTALRPDDISKLAAAFEVSADELLGVTTEPKRKGGPIGKARLVFERVSQLPRDRQQHIVRVVEDLLAAQRINSLSR